MESREMDSPRQDLIEGRNAIREALRAERPIDKIYVNRGSDDPALGRIIRDARAADIPVVEVDRRKLDEMSVTRSHQGVIGVAAAAAYSDIDGIFALAEERGEPEDLLALAEERGEPPFIVCCDEISDVHNLGAIIRSAECAGAHGVIIPKRRSAGLTAVVGKTSAGALEYLPVARVANIPSTLEALKKRGVWVYGAAAEGRADMWKTDLTGPICLVIGSEGDGLGRMVRQSCDELVSIPMRGHVDSLNASCAAAILIYEVLRRRMGA